MVPQRQRLRRVSPRSDCRIKRFGGYLNLGWQETEVLSDLELHAVDLDQETGNRCPVVHRLVSVLRN
jgi:hypothetical protein